MNRGDGHASREQPYINESRAYIHVIDYQLLEERHMEDLDENDSQMTNEYFHPFDKTQLIK